VRTSLVPDVVIHGEVKDLPAGSYQAKGLVDQTSPTLPVGMLEGIVKDEECGVPLHRDRGEAYSQGKEGLLPSPRADIRQGVFFIAICNEG